MALLTLADLMDEIQDEIVDKPQAQIVRAINKVTARISKEPCLLIRGTFTTLPAVTTGTVSVAQDSDAVTFSDAVIATTDPLGLVQIEGDSVWFTLTPTAATTGTLSSDWAKTTDASATYTLVRPAISLPATVGEIIEIGQPGMRPLQYQMTEFSRGTFFSSTPSSTPTSWMPYKFDSAAATPNDDLYRILLVPFPSERLTFAYTARPRPTRLTVAGATTQTIPLSDVWYEAIVEGVLFFCWKQEDSAGAQRQFGLYETALRRIRSQLLPAASIRPRPRGAGRGPHFTVGPLSSG